MKRIPLVCILGLVLILGGTGMILYYWMDQKNGAIAVGPPEGYEESSAKGGVRVEKLDIAGSVAKYDNILELVALAPGSGWLKFKTGSGISPTLSFNCVSHKDIQGFNRFSESLGLPIRAKLSGNILHLTSGTDKDSILASDNMGRENGTYSIRLRGFYKPKQPPRLAISRDQNGRVFLVEANDKPEQTEAFVAKK